MVESTKPTTITVDKDFFLDILFRLERVEKTLKIYTENDLKTDKARTYLSTRPR